MFEDNNSQGFRGDAQPVQMASDNIFSHAQSAPTVVQGNSSSATSRRTRRNLPGSIEEIEITGSRKKARARKAASPSKVNYISTSRKSRSSGVNFTWTWHKFWWMVALFAFLRLLMMENGVIDYYQTEDSIANDHHKFELVQKENASLVSEIHKIQTSPRYQKKLARRHLGVIAKGEYLILFSQDSAQDSSLTSL
jgi:cell division protein FtsB